jgi:hypothetical protein
MANVLKPLDPQITDQFAHKAPKASEPHDKPEILNLNVVTPTNATVDTVDKDTLQVRRMFKDASGAWAAYRRLKQQNVERNKKNQLIQRKLNNEPPYKPKYLESMGQDWRSNRPTGFLSTMVSRIQPPFRAVIEQATTLTYSKYPMESADAENKTKIFREEITKCIRSWHGFDDLVAQTTHENTCFGYCGWVWDDLRDWKPEFLRQDYTFFPIESPQETSQTQIVGRKRRYQIADLLPVLEEPKISASAGWHINNLVKSINNAIPAGRTLDADDDARRYEDWIREGSYGASYENDAKYVELGEIFVREPNGKVSRYLFDDKSGDEICTQLDRFNGMRECLNLFAVEIGSGSLMSSRGAGRDLYNTHVAVDKARNLVVDNVYLKGVLLLKKGPNAKAGVPPLTVMHPVCYVSDGYEVIPTNIPADVEDFLKLDQFVSNLAEIQVGTFLPSSPVETQGSKKTASEVNRVAAIENQLREGILTRWSRQFSRGVERMQRGICHPEHVKAASELKFLLDQARLKEQNVVWARREVVDAFDRSSMPLPSFLVPYEVPPHLDEDAIACCLNMMERDLPPSDILLMAYTSAAELLPDTAAQDAQMLDLIVQRYTGNPNINQDELMKLDISKKVGEETANSIILPKDQVEALAIEATRQQIVELQSIMAGQNVPVSPRDNDMVHLQTMTQKLLPVIQQAPPGSLTPEMTAPLASAMNHYVMHINQAEKKGGDKKLIAQYRKAAMEAHNHLTAGHGTPPPPNLVPAAAAKPHKAPRPHGGGHHGPTKVSQQVVGNAAQASDQSQIGQVSNIANPPKPPTAA